jgi:hypothetical protein
MLRKVCRCVNTVFAGAPAKSMRRLPIFAADQNR